jgi:hypothetical protein
MLIVISFLVESCPCFLLVVLVRGRRFGIIMSIGNQ